MTARAECLSVRPRQLRESLGLSQPAMALVVGVHVDTYRDLERKVAYKELGEGKALQSEPSRQLLRELYTYASVDLDYRGPALRAMLRGWGPAHARALISSVVYPVAELRALVEPVGRVGCAQ